MEPLSNLGTRIILSNVPPFIADHGAVPFMERLGVLRSPIRPLPRGCHEFAIHHILSHKRQVSIDLDKDTELQGSFVIPFEGRNYKVFYMTN